MADVAAFLRVTPAQVRRLIGTDRAFPVPARISSRVWRWERGAVEEWLRCGSCRSAHSATGAEKSIVERV